jgi:hypothetical protein
VRFLKEIVYDLAAIDDSEMGTRTCRSSSRPP